MIHHCTGKSIQEWYESAPEKFVVDPGPKPWWHMRNFTKQKAWGKFSFSSELLESSRHKIFNTQLSLLPVGYAIPNVAEIVDLLISSDINLLIGEWTRTRHLIKRGEEWSVVCVGVSRTGLIDIFDYYANRKASSRVGILLVQKL
ncbi:MAG TPA: hypothetical protein VGO63_04110 [Candidatus Paceibacterota bacterium]|jgi:hypothetical protein|nr:hypothetical protein [Candidatus Paceibacterota bacterium]